MNRPFFACGLLFAMLAGWMLAVGRAASQSAQAITPDTGAMECRDDQHAAEFFCGCPSGEWPCDAAYLATDACYANGCGLDRSTGEVYGWSCGPKAVEIVLLGQDQADASPGSIDCRAHYDATYDAAVYAPQAHSLADCDGSWLNPDERALDEKLQLFQALVAQRVNVRPDHPFYDEQAAADYTAAEIAAAEIHKPRFSAVICTLPQSRVVFKPETVWIAVKVRGERALELLGLADDWRALADLSDNSLALAEEARPEWRDYEEFLSTLPGGSSDRSASVSGLEPRSIPAAPITTDVLMNLADAAQWISDELRRIARPYVAKSHNSDSTEPTTR